MTDQTWPPPWTLKPTHGQPHDSSDIDGESIGWDLSFGFRLNIDHAYVTEFGDGLYDVCGGAPLYGRDLEALCRAVLAVAR